MTSSQDEDEDGLVDNDIEAQGNFGNDEGIGNLHIKYINEVRITKLKSNTNHFLIK